MFKNRSFRSRLLLWIMPILVLGLSALSFGTYFYIHNIIEIEFTQNMLTTTAKSADGINIWLKTLLLEPETIASTPAAKNINHDFKSIDVQNINRHILLHKKYPDIFEDIYAANRTGEYHTVRENGPDRFLFVGDISNRDYFKSIMSGGQAQITPPLISRTTGKPTIFIVAPIKDENDAPQGLIGAGISLDYVRVVAERLRAYKTGYGVVVNKDGALIYHPDSKLVMKGKLGEFEDPSVRELGKTMTAGGSGIFHYTYQGQKKMAFYHAIPIAGWSVATVVPEVELYAPAVRLLWVMVGITVLICIVVGSIILVAAFHLTRPILDLASHAQLIADGNLNPGQLRIENNDEIGLLGRTFNIMTTNLDHEINTIKMNETKYRSMLNSINSGIYRSVIHPYHKLIQVNTAMTRIFGYETAEEILAIPLENLYMKVDEYTSFIADINKKGFIKGKELRLLKKDGGIIWCNVSANVEYEESGEVKWINGFIEEITERKELTEQLRQSQKMEAIGTLAGGVAHDFNNLLTVIIGYGNMLKMNISTEGPAVKHMDHLLSAADKAAQLTKSLLAFSRKQVIDLKPADLNEIVDGMGKLFHRVIGEDIHLTFDLHPDPLPIMVDVGPIEQVLLNLATNARDSMPNGGLLCIGTELVTLTANQLIQHQSMTAGAYAVLSVSDNGMGMTDAVKQRIFEPFFSTKAVGKGTGLGLSILFGIVKQHEGDISVYSEPGIGTTFKIYLPIVQHGSPAPEGATLLPTEGGTETILIAEDNAEVRHLAHEVLASAGYRVILALDGENAITQFMEHVEEVDFVLLDVVMPRINGKEVYDTIKSIRPEVKALFMSGYTADIINQKGVLDEGLNYISKPLTPDALLRKVREVLNSA
jgi:PAS domain S-box-containing protein